MKAFGLENDPHLLLNILGLQEDDKIHISKIDIEVNNTKFNGYQTFKYFLSFLKFCVNATWGATFL
jgi:hypothetical protein